jgi:FKBP-type peptidyl-prolyl cis-trans isomerase SlyD
MDTRVVEAGKTVCLDYILSLGDGTLIDTTEHWMYVHGETQMPPGLARGLEGLRIGDRARLELPPEEAFGVVDPAAFQEVPRDIVPPAALRVGLKAELPGPHGTLIPFQIHAIQESTVTIDLNHPLAGQHVIFEVWVRHIQD